MVPAGISLSAKLRIRGDPPLAVRLPRNSKSSMTTRVVLDFAIALARGSEASGKMPTFSSSVLRIGRLLHVDRYGRLIQAKHLLAKLHEHALLVLLQRGGTASERHPKASIPVIRFAVRPG